MPHPRFTMRWSIRSLMFYTASLAAVLMFTQIRAEFAAFILLSTFCTLNFLLPVSLWRHMTYGALLGIVAVILVMMIYVKLHAGVAVASNYQESQAIDAAMEG
ncbi:hypothetical protein PLANPX_5323 [Lacipirellula parvula]|uniref:Uncharacterized protein n=2 Tax=Lacipirellula parvula TaxID=2650471 RepID=A0A5K7XKK3_9BACT|nr:hypothetical protein PLANPX_5323 [Lacipirellula parvula]